MISTLEWSLVLTIVFRHRLKATFCFSQRHLVCLRAPCGTSLISDPVFFLHHAQLDRLWWKWQHMTPGRLRQYNGETEANSSIAASLSDALHMGGLGLDATVGDIIETESEFLCYEY